MIMAFLDLALSRRQTTSFTEYRDRGMNPRQHFQAVVVERSLTEEPSIEQDSYLFKIAPL